MNGILGNSLVVLALIVSAGYALTSLGPRSLRRGLLAALGRTAARAPRFMGLGRPAQWLSNAAADKASGACGGCDSCGSEPESAPKSRETEIRVPVANIGRRI
jgi:hypothetical protein